MKYRIAVLHYAARYSGPAGNAAAGHRRFHDQVFAAANGIDTLIIGSGTKSGGAAAAQALRGQDRARCEQTGAIRTYNVAIGDGESRGSSNRGA